MLLLYYIGVFCRACACLRLSKCVSCVRAVVFVVSTRWPLVAAGKNWSFGRFVVGRTSIFLHEIKLFSSS